VEQWEKLGDFYPIYGFQELLKKRKVRDVCGAATLCAAGTFIMFTALKERLKETQSHETFAEQLHFAQLGTVIFLYLSFEVKFLIYFLNTKYLLLQ
jgi:hypothetical protein